MDGQYPKMCGNAAPIRGLAPYALEIAKRFDTGSRHDKMKVDICQCLDDFYKILSINTMVLTQEAQCRIATIGQHMCMCYSRLSSEAETNDERLWKMTPKLHLVQELCEHQVPAWGLSPSYFWTYTDEDLVG